MMLGDRMMRGVWMMLDGRMTTGVCMMTRGVWVMVTGGWVAKE